MLLKGDLMLLRENERDVEIKNEKYPSQQKYQKYCALRLKLTAKEIQAGSLSYTADSAMKPALTPEEVKLLEKLLMNDLGVLKKGWQNQCLLWKKKYRNEHGVTNLGI